MRFIWGHALHAFLITSQRQSNFLHYLSWACQRRLYRGWQRGGFSYYSLPDVSITDYFCPNWCCLVLQSVLQHLGYFLAMDFQPCTIWKISRDPILGVPSKSFVQASCSRFTAQSFWGYPLLLPVSLLFISDVFKWISKVVWGTWGFLPRELILRICLDFIGGLPIAAGLPRSFFPCSQGFHKVLGLTDLKLQEMS